MASVFLILLGMVSVSVVSGDCMTKEFTFTGIDDPDALSELQAFLTEQIENGGTVIIDTLVNGVDPPTTGPVQANAIDSTPTRSTTEPTPTDPKIPTTTNPERLVTADREVPNTIHSEKTGSTTESTSNTTTRFCHSVDPKPQTPATSTGVVVDINITEIGVNQVYCDVTTDGGDWIVFQRRQDGKVDFYRGWSDYVGGFGNFSNEFWLGLEKIHQLTKNGDCELRIDMIERESKTRYYAKYSSFKIGPASDKYRLSVSGFSGNVRDSFSSHNNMFFSTKDKDNDKTEGSCAQSSTGAWWYRYCHECNLNGKWSNHDKNVLVTTFVVWRRPSQNGDWINLEFTEMKLRKKN